MNDRAGSADVVPGFVERMWTRMADVFGIPPGSGPDATWKRRGPDEQAPIGIPVVYLDLNHWISLKEARRGTSAGERFRDVYSFLQTASRAGEFVVALSLPLYREVNKIRRIDRRTHLADVMGELSGFVTLASTANLLKAEVDQALHRRLGRPMFPRKPEPLGFGVMFAAGRPHVWGQLIGDPTTIENALAPKRASREEFEREMNLLAEYIFLRGPRPEDIPKLQGYRPELVLEGEEQRLRREQALAANLEVDASLRRRLDDVVLARELYYELGDELPALLWHAGISVESFLWKGKDWINQFLNDLPTIATQAALRYRRHKNPSHTWKLNDLRDSDALREAVPYCDIVVTERHARAMLQESDVDERFGTVLLSDLEELPAALKDRSQTGD